MLGLAKKEGAPGGALCESKDAVEDYAAGAALRSTRHRLAMRRGARGDALAVLSELPKRPEQRRQLPDTAAILDNRPAVDGMPKGTPQLGGPLGLDEGSRRQSRRKAAQKYLICLVPTRGVEPRTY
jgi:hypothetical protein